MKKIILSLFTLGLCSSVFAIDFDMQSSLSLDTNEGEVSLSPLTINLDSGVTLDTFDLIIREGDDFIFAPEIASIYENTTSDDLKKITFEGSFQDSVQITGLKIRTYDEKINAKIGLNWTGDDEVDVYTTKYIELDTDQNNDDNMKPLPVINATYEIQNDAIVISRTTSADLDVIKQVVRVLKNGNFVKDTFITAGQTSFTVTDLDLENYAYTVEVYAKDQYYSSEHVVLEIPQQEMVEEEELEVIDENLPEKYVISIDSVVLSAITTIIDEKLDNNWGDLNVTEKTEALNARNDLLKLMEDYLLGNISQSATSTQMGGLLVQLLPYIK